MKKDLRTDARMSGNELLDNERKVCNNEESLEWFDTYQNAYRIAYENHLLLKQWLTKVSFIRLVQQIQIDYIEKIDFGSENIDQKILIENYMREAIENKDPIPMVRAYTEKTAFVTKLNEDLAKIGSDFRFQLSFKMMNGNCRDNDPPSNLGEFIFASILSHHHRLNKYRHFIGKTYRGMNLKQSDLDQYQQGKFILTRTFLSSSTDQTIAESFLNSKELINYPVLCIYHIRNSLSTIDVHQISKYPNEKEILIIPFVTFRIINVQKNLHGISLIELDQSEIN